MSATNAFETLLLNLLFNNSNIANIGDATGIRGSVAAGSLYISLHTADPGEAGTQTTSEATYTGYARVAVARTAGGFTIVGSNASNTAPVNFPTCTAGTNTITHFGIGSSLSGAGDLLFKGATTASLAVSAGIAPTFAVGELDTNAD